MSSIFGVAYIILFLGFVITSFIILFHLSRYSLNRGVASFATIVFVVVMVVLLSTNALLFFSLPWDSLLTGGLYLPS